MPRLPEACRLLARAPSLLALVLLAASARAMSTDVYVRGTPDGLIVRVPDADLAECELLRPLPERIVLVVRGASMPTRVVPGRYSLARSIRVVGPEVLGADESRVLIELASSALVPNLEEVGSGVVLSLREPQVAPPPPPAPAPEPPEVAEAVRPGPETPWARARARVRADRERMPEGGAAPADAGMDASERARLQRDAEEQERRSKRLEREQRVAEREGRTPPPPKAAREREPAEPAVEPAQAETAPRIDDRDRRVPRVRPPAGPPPRTGRQPSPALPAPAGMVRVPSGSFLMGTVHGGGFADEEPQHPVDLPAYFIDATEVTVGQWRNSPIRLPEQPAWNVEDDRPVVNVTWLEAEQYCEWRGGRLPSEAEWEKAARGDGARVYPWGDGFSTDLVNSGVAGDPFERSSPVGSFPDGASPHGALDMAGNAWEWTADWYDPDTYDARPVASPRGPHRGAHKVARGGSFRGSYSVNVRSAIRLPLAASTRRDDVGFRCVVDPR